MRVWVFSALSVGMGVIASGLLLALTVFNSPYGVSSIQYSNVPLKSEKVKNNSELIRASFLAPNNYLGVFFVPFTKTKPLPEVPLTLRLYDRKSGKQIHTHTYVAKNFSDKSFFPIGIPTITQSGNKIFEFSISKEANSTNLEGLKLDVTKQTSTIHLFDRRELRKNNFLSFLIQKTVTSMQVLNWWPFVLITLSSAIFPFIAALLVKFGVFGIRILSSKALWMFLLGLLTFVLILVPYTLADSLSMIWIIGYLVYVVRTRPQTKYHYIWALGFLVLCPLFLSVGDEVRAEKSAIFVFFFLCFGVGHEIMSMFRHPERYNQANDSA